MGESKVNTAIKHSLSRVNIAGRVGRNIGIL